MNTILKRMNSGKTVLNGWLSEATVLKTEILSKMGFHSLTIDMQHGLQNHNHMLNGLYGMRGSGVTPMVRIAANREEYVASALDAGALGIICPMVNDKSIAEEFALALRYPPQGIRSNAPARSSEIYADYNSKANAEVLGFAMIETKQAVDNIDAIASTEGINGLYIGPNDLSISHGLQPGLDRREPFVVELIDYILSKSKEHKIFVGIQTASTEYALDMAQKGFDMVTLSTDIHAMVWGMNQIIKPVVDFLPE